MVIKITLPFRTPTVNHLYGQKPGGFGRARFIKPEARKLREEIKEIIPSQVGGIGGYEDLRDVPLSVNVEIHENWLTKKGEVKRKDVANREKFLIDSVFDALGMDDKFIFEHKILKCQDTNEYALIKIEEFKNERD